MARLVQPANSQQPDREPPCLPVRWAVILVLSCAIGVSVGPGAGWAAGVAAGLTAAAALHVMVD